MKPLVPMTRASSYPTILLVVFAMLLAGALAPGAAAQLFDEVRARRLYVSDDHAEHTPGHDYARDIAIKAQIDRRYVEASRGVMQVRKVTYRSPIGDLDIPAYLFQPLITRGARGHAAFVWVHGSVHGNWDIGMFPFVREAVERGYVVMAPEYRGSTGYGAAFHNEIDYGGYEVDDVLGAVAFLKSLPQVDPGRLGIMGWSHGGLISLHAVFRDDHPFVAAAAIAPVTNLVFRLSYKGPAYQRAFATQKRIGGLPFEKREIYVQRSPVYHVHKLEVPLLVHMATNDEDVDFVEGEMLIDALRSRKPHLSETTVYQDPPGGHGFSRLVDRGTLRRLDTPAQLDSWSRTWAFFERHLRPAFDPSRVMTSTESGENSR